MADASAAGTRWLHAKTGGVYTVLMHATEEATGRPVIVYRGEDDRVWTRPEAEFFDGRFSPLVGSVTR